MRKLLVGICIGAAFTVCVFGTANVIAQPYSKPQGRYGLLTLAAATATQIPFTLSGRQGLLVQNLSQAAIYCGYDNAVTNLNGINVAAGGGTFSASAGWDGNTLQVWCYSAVIQVAPANTRWTEIR
jgi:hypothetical protein